MNVRNTRYAGLVLPLGLLFLAGCASSGNNTAQNDYAKTSPQGYNASGNTTGYKALNEGRYGEAVTYYEAANRETPDNPVYALNLAAAYQREGRMTEAEPLLRMAVLNGDDVHPVIWTTDLAQNHTVAEVACQNLEMGLQPAIVAAKCQRTLLVALATGPATYLDYTTPGGDEQTASMPQMAAATPTAPAPAAYVAPVAIFAAAKPQPGAFTLPAPAPFTVLARGPTLGNIYFDFDKATLTAPGQTFINAVAVRMHNDPTLDVVLLGKADHPGTDTYNMALSDRRAVTVRQALNNAGIPNSRIGSSYVGERETPVYTAEDMREQRNRVVEITIN